MEEGNTVENLVHGAWDQLPDELRAMPGAERSVRHLIRLELAHEQLGVVGVQMVLERSHRQGDLTMILLQYRLEHPGGPRSELVRLMSPEDQEKVEELLDGSTL